jgi:trans-aconitate methyltransferase
MYRIMLGGIAVAPLPTKLNNVLDLGCGTGIWTREFAVQHPEAQVYGVDLSPPTPSNDELKNVHFVQGNIETDWTFTQLKYDFIYARLLITSIKDWSSLFQRVHDHLTPGGIFEVYEGMPKLEAEDGSVSFEDSAFMRWYEGVASSFRARGVDPFAPTRFVEYTKAAGLEIIEDRQVRMYFDAVKGQQYDENQTLPVNDKYRSAIEDLLEIMTERFFDESSTPTISEMRKLAPEAREDLNQNAFARGYYGPQ